MIGRLLRLGRRSRSGELCGQLFNRSHRNCHLPAGHPGMHEAFYVGGTAGDEWEDEPDRLAHSSEGGGDVTRWGGAELVLARPDQLLRNRGPIRG